MIHDNDPSFWQFHLENARTTGNRELEAVALTNLGASYAYSEQYARALDRYHQAIPIFQELGDRNREIWALNNIGTTYYHLTQYNRAIAVYLKAIAVSRSAGTLVREGWVLRSLAHTYRSMGRYDDAIAALNEAIGVFQDRGSVEGLTEATQLLTDVRQERNSLEKKY